MYPLPSISILHWKLPAEYNIVIVLSESTCIAVSFPLLPPTITTSLPTYFTLTCLTISFTLPVIAYYSCFNRPLPSHSVKSPKKTVSQLSSWVSFTSIQKSCYRWNMMASEQELAEMERMSSDWHPDAPVTTRGHSHLLPPILTTFARDLWSGNSSQRARSSLNTHKRIQSTSTKRRYTPNMSVMKCTSKSPWPSSGNSANLFSLSHAQGRWQLWMARYVGPPFRNLFSVLSD